MKGVQKPIDTKAKLVRWVLMLKEKSFIQMLCLFRESGTHHLRIHLLCKIQTKPNHRQQDQNKVPRVPAPFSSTDL